MDARLIYKKLYLDEDLISSALSLCSANKKRFEKYKSYLLKGKSGKLNGLDALSKLAAVLYTLPEVYRNYVKKGIPAEVFFDTFSDIAIWCHNAYVQ